MRGGKETYVACHSLRSVIKKPEEEEEAEEEEMGQIGSEESEYDSKESGCQSEAE